MIFLSPIFVVTLGLPGPLTEGNSRADKTVQSSQALCSLFSDPVFSHQFFHQNAKGLAKDFGLPLSDAQAIVHACPHCASFPHFPEAGVNPQGLFPNNDWQMDVTHVPSLSPWKYLHVCVDTFSGAIWATPKKGKASSHVISHLVAAITILGKPSKVKTDNAPAYCSSAVADFCQQWSITLTYGIPYNSTGQAIVKHANRSLKALLEKQLKREIPDP